MTFRQAILATLAYHDIFDYPLTAEEIHKFLIKKATKNSVTKELQKLYLNQGKFYALPGRQKIHNTRLAHQKYSHFKLKRARLYSKILSIIPTVKFIGISGALAMQNSHKNDDIDIVTITSKGTLWTTRFLANIILLPFRRFPNSKNVSNRACLNIFIDESNLAISARNLYTAHEICQIRPIYDSNKTYSKLIRVNSWVWDYLPNWSFETKDQWLVASSSKNRGVSRKSIVNRQLSIVERFFRSIQLRYMKQRITTEKIGPTQLFFHPQNTQEWVLKEYLKRYNTIHARTK